ncbi:hypothetical protein ACP70R_027376 [Stipagrostis hirtigluma subsp. patula]
MEFTFDDGKRLCALLSRQSALVDKKRRWLGSMIPKPDGQIKRVKRPKFLNVGYLPESYIRSDEISCKKVRASIEKSFSSESNGYTNHLVQDGLCLFDTQKRGNKPLDPEYLDIMQRTISKLSYEALQSVACIVSHNKSSSDKTRLVMEKIVRSHLPSYLNNLEKKDITSQLFNIFKNPCSYQSCSVSIVTPISPQLLSAINHVLDGLDGMPVRALDAMNRKLREKSCTPRFGMVARFSRKGHLVEMVRKRCNKILKDLEEGNHMPKKLAKAMSVANLYHKQKLRSVDISQSEFFPFDNETISLQNDILNALWSLRKLKHGKLKILRPILDHDSKVQKMHLKAALRNYLIECLFECDEAVLPDEALRAIAFVNRISGRQPVVSTEERKEAEVEAVLNLSSHLKALVHCCVEECSCGEELFSLGNDSCNEDNDFTLSDTSYFKLSSEQQQMHEPCCSSSMPDTPVMGERSWSETVGATPKVSGAEDSDFKSQEVLRKTCERTEYSRGTGHYVTNEAVGSGMKPYADESVDVNHLKKSRCSDINAICDETSIVAHKLIGQMLDKWLLAENNEVDELPQDHLEGGLVSQAPQDDNMSPNLAEHGEGDVLVHAVERLLPNLPKRLHRQSQEDTELANTLGKIRDGIKGSIAFLLHVLTCEFWIQD